MIDYLMKLQKLGKEWNLKRKLKQSTAVNSTVSNKRTIKFSYAGFHIKMNASNSRLCKTSTKFLISFRLCFLVQYPSVSPNTSLKKCNYVHTHQFPIFHHSLMHSRAFWTSAFDDAKGLCEHARSLNCLMHNVLEMIYWFHFNVSMAINNAQNDGTAIKLHGSFV